MTASRSTSLTRASTWLLAIAIGGALFYALLILNFYETTNPGPDAGYQDTFEYGFGVAPVMGGFAAIALLVAACALASRRPLLAAVFALASPPLLAATLATQAEYLRDDSYTAHYVLWRVGPPFIIVCTFVGVALVMLLLDAWRRMRSQGRADRALRQGEAGGT